MCLKIEGDGLAGVVKLDGRSTDKIRIRHMEDVA
ncbi:hypothetical protein RLEG3_15140 [Rhizobium leguminosarum bv. trifolii WSM1689]|nr:hypothetical protein RLEG3_15140 [Rhizobium leguminosarum bv. trifolii WSM1689]